MIGNLFIRNYNQNPFWGNVNTGFYGNRDFCSFGNNNYMNPFMSDINALRTMSMASAFIQASDNMLLQVAMGMPYSVCPNVMGYPFNIFQPVMPGFGYSPAVYGGIPRYSGNIWPSNPGNNNDNNIWPKDPGSNNNNSNDIWPSDPGNNNDNNIWPNNTGNNNNNIWPKDTGNTNNINSNNINEQKKKTEEIQKDIEKFRELKGEFVTIRENVNWKGDQKVSSLINEKDSILGNYNYNISDLRRGIDNLEWSLSYETDDYTKEQIKREIEEIKRKIEQIEYEKREVEREGNAKIAKAKEGYGRLSDKLSSILSDINTYKQSLENADSYDNCYYTQGDIKSKIRDLEYEAINIRQELDNLSYRR